MLPIVFEKGTKTNDRQDDGDKKCSGIVMKDSGRKASMTMMITESPLGSMAEEEIR